MDLQETWRRKRVNLSLPLNCNNVYKYFTFKTAFIGKNSEVIKKALIYYLISAIVMLSNSSELGFIRQLKHILIMIEFQPQ